jgi:hypothetical protein
VQRFEISAGATVGLTIHLTEATYLRLRSVLDRAYRMALREDDPPVATAVARAVDEYVYLLEADLADDETLGRIVQQKLEPD